MASEMERLQAMYAELGDEHLRDLADEPEELTDDARLALAAEMKKRGFDAGHAADAGLDGGPDTVVGAVAEPELQSGFGAAIPGVIPAGSGAVEQALEAGGEVRQGMARLLSFYDGLELTRACEVLEDGNVEFAIEEVAGDAMSGVAPHFEIWVGEAEQKMARGLLRAHMGLFPVAEVEGGELTDGVVGVFETRAEADGVQQMLAGDGFQARVESDDETGFSVVVAPAEQERALSAVADRMGLE